MRWRSAGGLAAHHIQGRRRVTRGGPWGRAQQSDETSAMCGITQVEKGIPGLRAFGGHSVTLRACYDLWSRSRTDLAYLMHYTLRDYRAWSWPIAHDLSSHELVWIPQVACHKSSKIFITNIPYISNLENQKVRTNVTPKIYSSSS